MLNPLLFYLAAKEAKRIGKTIGEVKRVGKSVLGHHQVQRIGKIKF